MPPKIAVGRKKGLKRNTRKLEKSAVKKVFDRLKKPLQIDREGLRDGHRAKIQILDNLRALWYYCIDENNMRFGADPEFLHLPEIAPESSNLCLVRRSEWRNKRINISETQYIGNEQPDERSRAKCGRCPLGFCALFSRIFNLIRAHHTMTFLISLGGKAMNCEKFKRRLSLFLCILMVMGTMVTPLSVFADEEVPETSEDTASEAAVTAVEDEDVSANGSEASDGASDADASAADETAADEGYTADYDEVTLKKLLEAVSYREYIQQYVNVPNTSEDVTVLAVDALNKELTTAETSIIDCSEISTEAAYGDAPEGQAVETGDSGNTVFNITVPETGMYSISFTYTSRPQADSVSSDISTTIERMLYIDDQLPFSETRYLYFPRVWEYEYDKTEDGDAAIDEIGGEEYLAFPKDKNGNDTRPRRWEVAMWQSYYVRDWLGYEIDPLKFYLTEGEHTLTLVSNRESMIVHSIELYSYEEEISYEDWLAEKKADGAKEITDCESIKVQAENPEYVSVQNIIPSNDRTSSLSEPQDPAVIKYNLLSTPTVNNWMRYKVTVEESGLYSIVFRFRQNELIGCFTSRRMKVNGEIPYREASYLRYDYETGFQSSYANNGENENLLIYLEEGENIIEFEVVLGEMVEYVYEIEQTIEELNEAYQTMLMITGPAPDTYRDYGFGRLCPEAVDAIAKGADTLIEIEESLIELTGEQSDQSNALGTISELLEKMAKNEYEIAPNFITFKNYIISLSDWLYQMLSQPLKLDYFVVGAADQELPDPTATTLAKLGFEVSAFIASFTMDYTTIGFKDDASTAENDVVEMWATSDRETMLIQRYIIDNYFTPDTKISVRIKVITAGLTEAILAGIGPDVSFMDTANTITFGMRTALLPLEDYEGFDELMEEFPDAMMDKLTMVGQDNIEHTYGIPTTLVFSMAFFRTDVLSNLGLEIPNSWEELYSVMSTLGYNNLEVGLPTGLVGTELFVYQQEDGGLYRDDGKCVNLDTNSSLSAFKSLCEMFTKYSSPVSYDITRFRTGEVPIMIPEDAITIYNTLMTYYELRGLWQMTPVIGSVNSDGSINRTTIANTQAMIIPRGGDNPEIAWKFVKWYCGSDSQTRQARESVAVSAPTNKFSTANIEALLSQKWTDQERAAIKNQIENLVGVPEYPGAYILTTYVQFAFLDAYNNGVDPSEAMLDVVLDMNKEISRKRVEFGLDAYDVSYGNQVKEQSEATNAAADDSQ